jgi:hypothetical protein
MQKTYENREAERGTQGLAVAFLILRWIFQCHPSLLGNNLANVPPPNQLVEMQPMGLCHHSYPR